MTLYESNWELEWIRLMGNRVASANYRILRLCYLPTCSPLVILGAAPTDSWLQKSDYNLVWPLAPAAFGFFYLSERVKQK